MGPQPSREVGKHMWEFFGTMFEAARYITGPFALIAFVAVCGVVWRWRAMDLELNRIKALPEEDRQKALMGIEQTFGQINTDTLTRKHRYDIVKQIIDTKYRKWLSGLIAATT